MCGGEGEDRSRVRVLAWKGVGSLSGFLYLRGVK